MTVLDERFWSKVDAAGDCWNWMGWRHAGYGGYYRDGRDHRAHRVAYEILVGPIPADLTLDHLCRNRACVNPDHLEPVTQGVNSLRGYGPAAQAARQEDCVNGHPFNGENLRIASDGKRRCRACNRARARQRRALAKSA